MTLGPKAAAFEVVDVTPIVLMVVIPTARMEVMMNGRERAATTPSTDSLNPSFLNSTMYGAK